MCDFFQIFSIAENTQSRNSRDGSGSGAAAGGRRLSVGVERVVSAHFGGVAAVAAACVAGCFFTAGADRRLIRQKTPVAFLVVVFCLSFIKSIFLGGALIGIHTSPALIACNCSTGGTPEAARPFQPPTRCRRRPRRSRRRPPAWAASPSGLQTAKWPFTACLLRLRVPGRLRRRLPLKSRTSRKRPCCGPTTRPQCPQQPTPLRPCPAWRIPPTAAGSRAAPGTP